MYLLNILPSFICQKYFIVSILKRETIILTVKLRFLSDKRAKRIEHYERKLETYQVGPGDQYLWNRNSKSKKIGLHWEAVDN